MKQPRVYIMANKRNGTLYTGVTSDLPKRAFEHREGLIPGFSAKYGCKILVWYEVHESMVEAIAREKQIKAGSRRKKLALIETLNPEWKDLYESIILRRHWEGTQSLRAKRSNPEPRLRLWIASSLRSSQ